MVSSESARPPPLHCRSLGLSEAAALSSSHTDEEEEEDDSGSRASVSTPTSDTTDTSDTSDTSDMSELSAGERDQEGGWGWVVVAASFYCVAIVGGVSSFSYIGGSLDFWATL